MGVEPLNPREMGVSKSVDPSNCLFFLRALPFLSALSRVVRGLPRSPKGMSHPAPVFVHPKAFVDNAEGDPQQPPKPGLATGVPTWAWAWGWGFLGSGVFVFGAFFGFSAFAARFGARFWGLDGDLWEAWEHLWVAANGTSAYFGAMREKSEGAPCVCSQQGARRARDEPGF